MNDLNVSANELADIASTLISRSMPVVVLGGQLDKIVAAFPKDDVIVTTMAEVVSHPEWLDQPLTIVVSDLNAAFGANGLVKDDARPFIGMLMTSYDAAVIAPLTTFTSGGFFMERAVKVTMH